jgi:integrase/recombinase XerD
MDSQVIQGCMGLQTAKTVSRINKEVDSSAVVRVGECLSQTEDAALQNYLLKEAPNSTWQHRRNLTMLHFILDAAIADDEVTNARTYQFCFDGVGCVFCPIASSVAGTTLIPLSNVCAQAIRKWLLERGTLQLKTPTDLAFPGASGQMLSPVTLYALVHATLQKFGYNGLHADTGMLRNTWCRRQLLAGVDSEFILRRLRRMRVSAV